MIFDNFVECENIKINFPITSLEYLDILYSKDDDIKLILEKINEIFKINQGATDSKL